MNRPTPLRSDISEGFEHLISGYIEERDREAWALFGMVAEERFDEILSIAHNLKGSGGSHGLPELTELGLQLENAALARDHSAAESVVMQLNAFVKTASVTPQVRPNSSEPTSDGWLASRILVIDDSPAMLTMTAAMLRMDGHQVHVASSAEQGLEALRKWRPDVMLVDLRLPGLNGLEFTRLVRKNAATKDAIVLAMTALCGADIEKTAAEAGFDGFISKPFDTDRLTTFVRWNLQRRSKTPATVPARQDHEPGALERAFLREACVRCRTLVSDFDTGFHAAEVRPMLLRWADEAGQYGFDAIPPLARRAAGLLEGLWWDAPYLKESLTGLLAALDALESGTPAAFSPSPSGESKPMRIALAGFDPPEAMRVSALVERYGASVRVVSSAEMLERGQLRQQIENCDLAILCAGNGDTNILWLLSEPSDVPCILTGERKRLMSLDPRVLSRAREVLVSDWQSGEALPRLRLAISRASEARTRAEAPPGAAQPVTLIVDDDPSIQRLTQAILEKLGTRVIAAANGEEARQILAVCQPRAAIVDLNLPGMNGFEVMEMIRAQAPAVRVMLLTGHSNEKQIRHGLAMGAADYVTKPFNPIELASRLKRLLS